MTFMKEDFPKEREKKKSYFRYTLVKLRNKVQ